MKEKADSSPPRRQTLGVFPTPVWVVEWECECDTDLSRYLNDLRQWRTQDRTGETKSNRGGWHSPPGVFNRPLFKGLADRIENEARRINPDVRLGEGWANINGPGAANAEHIHPECILSGVFYISACEDSGVLVFHDPRSVAVMVGGLPDYVTKPHEIAPRPGMLVLFPAWLPHSVRENRSESDRVSLAFNCHRTVIR